MQTSTFNVVSSSRTVNINAWLEVRQQLLNLFNKLCIIKPSSYNLYTAELLEEFCKTLEQYTLTLNSKNFKSQFPELQTGEIGAKFRASNLKALYFRQKYQETNNYTHLKDDLSWLGVELAERLDLEDQLITKYRKPSNNFLK